MTTAYGTKVGICVHIQADAHTGWEVSASGSRHKFHLVYYSVEYSIQVCATMDVTRIPR